METRRNSLCVSKLCRFCLCRNDPLTTLYDSEQAPKSTTTLPLKILSTVSIEVFPSDRMPTFICPRCKYFINIAYDFKQLCRQADERILKFIQNGTPLEAMSWPSSLAEIWSLISNKHGSRGVVTKPEEANAKSEDMSDSEMDDVENIYNFKMADGANEMLKGTCIKLVSSSEADKSAVGGHHKGYSTITKLTRHVRSHAGERAYPCKYCDKSFIKSHHYTRHLRLKHRATLRMPRESIKTQENYKCEDCEENFVSQDDLIYHSAIHATQNLICPLCQEQFPNVDAVTAHIKSHVSGTEYMCDFCELIFTTKEKLDNHMSTFHDDELSGIKEDAAQDESSVEMDADDDDDAIHVKEENDHMVVEIKKAHEFMLSDYKVDAEEKNDNTNSEESEPEVTYTELATVDTLALANENDQTAKDTAAKTTVTPDGNASITLISNATPKPAIIGDEKASILRKAESINRKMAKVQSLENNAADKKGANTQPNNTNTQSGASEKSLKLLEKDLQELKRTNTRAEIIRGTAKSIEISRNKKPQIHTSTPKPTRTVEEKKGILAKAAAIEKKFQERRVITKENKEPKEQQKASNTSAKDDKEKETPKISVKNGTNEKSIPDEGVRRSTRPSKIKDYAKMIKDKSQESAEDENDSDYQQSESEEAEKEPSPEIRTKARRASVKQAPAKASPTPAVAAKPAPKKRGRPRKDQSVPAKVQKQNSADSVPKAEKSDIETPVKAAASPAAVSKTLDCNPTPIPISALPPGVKAIPLPSNARPTGEVCEMQIGKRLVKVQKIVMTKAEVEVMTKKGLVEMKDGTMVLKPGIKLPAGDPAALKTSLVGGETDADKESPTKKPAPTRCELEDF